MIFLEGKKKNAKEISHVEQVSVSIPLIIYVCLDRVTKLVE